MKIAFVLFDQLTLLDFIGFYDAIARMKFLKQLEGLRWDLCAMNEEVKDELGVKLQVNRVRPDLSDYDLVFVPGGLGTRTLRFDEEFIHWLRSAERVTYKVSVCTGALLLGAAGLLEGKRATTNGSATGLLAPYCREVIPARIVRDGDVITGGGVSASLDLGLYIVELLAGTAAVGVVQSSMDYPYYVPGRVGSSEDYVVPVN